MACGEATRCTSYEMARKGRERHRQTKSASASGHAGAAVISVLGRRLAVESTSSISSLPAGMPLRRCC